MPSFEIGVYGGSFDPITFGHLEIIHRATAIFSKVIVVICPNYAKPNSEFTPAERKLFIEKALADSEDYLGGKIEVCILPPSIFLASYAQARLAGTLIRGLRDDIDFNAEQKIGETNKTIYPDIETIYLMPSPDFVKVSSSWAKSLVGFYGWKQTLDKFVPDCAIKALETKWLERQIRGILSACEREGIIRDLKMEDSISEIIRAYWNREYHNTTHIAEMLLNLTCHVTNCQYLYGNEISEKDILKMKLAIILHDISPVEEYCFGWPENNGLFVVCDANYQIYNLIMATKHSSAKSVERLSICEQIIHDLDLIILATDDYETYAKNVKSEYVPAKCSEEAFIQGRIDFLQDMCLRERIFYTRNLALLFQDKAINNMMNERVRLLETQKQGA